MRILLDGANNTRDLGGIPIGDRFIKSHRLIRSGALSALSPQDIRILQKYPLRKVIDLRAPAEIARRKDIVIDGVEYISLPLLGERTLGVTREQSLAEQLLEMASDVTFDAERYMQNIYRNLITSDSVAGQFRRFFDILLTPCDGAILWHCSAGKDRVGVCTALLLMALGADRQTVLKDYLLTNQFVTEEIRQSVKGVCDTLGDAADPAVIKEMVTVLYSVRRSYLDSVFQALESTYGTVENYLSRKILLTEAEIHQLKGIYLEP